MLRLQLLRRSLHRLRVLVRRRAFHILEIRLRLRQRMRLLRRLLPHRLLPHLRETSFLIRVILRMMRRILLRLAEMRSRGRRLAMG